MVCHCKNPILQKSFRWFDTYEQVMEAVSGRTAKLLIIEGDLEKNARVRAEVERRVKVMIVNSGAGEAGYLQLWRFQGPGDPSGGGDPGAEKKRKCWRWATGKTTRR